MFDVIVNSSSPLREWISFGADMSILAITLYTTWKTFIDKKIKLLNYSSNSRMFDGDYISLTVENTTLSPISIQEVNVIYNNQYKLQIEKFDTPLILEPMHATNIEMKPFTSLSKLSLFDLDKMKFYVEFKTTKGIIYDKFSKFKLKPLYKGDFEIITTLRKIFNGKIMPYDIKYILLIRENNETKTIFINNAGIMSDDIYGKNAIPREMVNDKDVVLDCIKSIFDKYNPNAVYQLMYA